MHGWGLFFFLLFLLVIFGAGGWVAFTQYRARRAGLPPPSFRSYIPFINGNSAGNYPAPRASGPIEWIKDKISLLRNKRSARGAYEEPTEGPGYVGPRRGRGLDPDDAWDARVVNEADAYGPGGYYEEQELGLHTPAPEPEPYGGAGYGGSAMPAYGEGERGRSKSRDAPSGIIGGQRGLDARYDEEMGVAPRDNPFGDQHEASSMRDVSPRPVIDTSAASRLGHTKGPGSHDDSPTERRSMFRESL